MKINLNINETHGPQEKINHLQELILFVKIEIKKYREELKSLGKAYKKCSVETCGRDNINYIIKKGYCNKHYKRMMKYGDPLQLKKPSNWRAEID